jgi:ribosomal protein S18 acetylase RimI-like enzyme
MLAFTSGNDLLREHPHAAFDRTYHWGYEVWYRIESKQECPSFRKLIVQVRLKDQVVAEADFADDGSAAHCQNVRVEPADQRRGIATAMYLFAEKVFGKSIRNHWAGDSAQTAAAKALWANPSRPFGRRLS